MVSVAVVAILAAVAMASYKGQIRKSRRSAATAYAMDVVAKQQQFLLDRRAYATSVTGSTSSNGLGLTIPPEVATYYTLAFSPPVDNTTFPLAFTLVLVPQGDQTRDTCGSLSISNQLVKSTSGSGSNCW
jgi:type IV pilus assembly protein PilE